MPAGYRPFYSLQDATGLVTGRTADVGASNTDVTMHIVNPGNATVIVEASDDGVKFTNVSNPPTGYVGSTIVVLRPIVPYYRARVTVYATGVINAMVGAGSRPNGLMVNIAEKGVHS